MKTETILRAFHTNDFLRLEATCHKWQRKIMWISWMDRVTNKEIMTRNIQRRHLRWFGDIHRLDPGCLTRQALEWMLSQFLKKPGWPRMNWTYWNWRAAKSHGWTEL